MRIIKDAPNAITIIVGEMLNIEMGALHFIDGNPVEVGEDITLEEYRGYPKIIDGNVVNTIRAAFGYVYVPVGTDLDNFEVELSQEIQRMEDLIDRRGGYQLRNYHTVRAGYHTNVKVQSAQKITHRASQSFKGGARRDGCILPTLANNVIRQFNQNPNEDGRRGRFTWCVCPIDKFDFTISSNNIEDAISRYACSVFYDKDDICTLHHNNVTFEFSQSLLKGHSRCVDESVVLFKYGNPLLFELSDYWKMRTDNGNPCAFMHNIQENKVFSIDFDAVKFRPVRLDGESYAESTEICSMCRSVLWGDNYALAGNIKEPNNPLCTAACPICAHTRSYEKSVESKYFRVFRVTFPRSVDDMLALQDITEDKKDILKEALKGVDRKELVSNDSRIKYIMIGNKYVAFDCINHFLFTRLSVHPDFMHRKVCSAKLIK